MSNPPTPSSHSKPSNPSKQSATRGSGYSEHDRQKPAAPTPDSTGKSPSTGGAKVAEKADSQARTKPPGRDADDQLASGKTPPGGTNTNGGVSNAPDRRK